MKALEEGALERLEADLGGERYVTRELVETFLREAPRIVAVMQAALQPPNRRELHRGAHSLRSTAATFGARTLSDLCRDLEAESGAGFPADAAARVEAVAREWARAEAELREWLARG